MKPCCIITDSSAQFINSTNSQNDLILIPFGYKINGAVFTSSEDISLDNFPQISDQKSNIELTIPSLSYFTNLFQKASEEYDQVIGIFISASISSMADNASKAAHTSPARNRIHIIDSLTIANGLGYLVQKALDMVKKGIPARDIEAEIRKSIPKIYTVISTLSTSYLHYSGFLDLPQVISLEMMGYYPIFTIEEGQLTSVQKVKSIGGITNFFQEFLGEFSDLESVSLSHNDLNFAIDSKLLRDTCKELHPGVNFQDVITNLPNTALFGRKNLIFSIAEK